MYDAYGAFLYGATGFARGFHPLILVEEAHYLHSWNNNPINTHDTMSGIDAIGGGGTLSIVDYKPPVHYPRVPERGR